MTKTRTTIGYETLFMREYCSTIVPKTSKLAVSIGNWRHISLICQLTEAKHVVKAVRNHMLMMGFLRRKYKVTSVAVHKRSHPAFGQVSGSMLAYSTEEAGEYQYTNEGAENENNARPDKRCFLLDLLFTIRLTNF